jgi:hypothetical protein
VSTSVGSQVMTILDCLSIAVQSESALPEANRFPDGWPTVLQH